LKFKHPPLLAAMIFYKNTGINFFCNVFKYKGSVFPLGFSIAFPVAICSCVLEWLNENEYVDFGQPAPDQDIHKAVMNESAVWGGFTFLVGFLVVFRTSIAYGRFWDGVTSTHKMRAEWFDSCASICAFCHHSNATEEAIDAFQNTLIRLYSLLHAVALAEIEDTSAEDLLSIEAFSLDLIDDCFVDDESLIALRDSNCKPELAFQWIQQFIVENIQTGILSIPPPLLSRAFQELANGMVEFHEALKVSSIPFPFPYAQTCDFLLLVHGLMTPVVVSQWVNGLPWVFIFSFMQLFIMWSLKAIAVELENPFGRDANDLDPHLMQEEMNTHLLLLVSSGCRRTPKLQSAGHDDGFSQGHIVKDMHCPSTRPDGMRAASLNAAWLQMATRERACCESEGSDRPLGAVPTGGTASIPFQGPVVRSVRVDGRAHGAQVRSSVKARASTATVARASLKSLRPAFELHAKIIEPAKVDTHKSILKPEAAPAREDPPKSDHAVATSTSDKGVTLDMGCVTIDFDSEYQDPLHLQISMQGWKGSPGSLRKPKEDFDENRSAVPESTHENGQELEPIVEHPVRSAQPQWVGGMPQEEMQLVSSSNQTCGLACT